MFLSKHYWWLIVYLFLFYTGSVQADKNALRIWEGLQVCPEVFQTPAPIPKGRGVIELSPCKKSNSFDLLTELGRTLSCCFNCGQDILKSEVLAWESRRNSADCKMEWRFTTEDARVKLAKLYPTINLE